MSKSSKHNKVRITQKERKFLLENEVCRIATSHDDKPHVVPVAYIYDKETITFATDFGTRKYRNLEVNKNVSVVIDVYDPSGENKAIVIQGKAVIIERGTEFKRLYQIFYKKFEWVRKDPWKEGEAPFVRVNALNKVSWVL
jgi:nitroimidazol reductase NimA-like FMN-containing flavoprotein (pyridoxamine 5'-phosphate oxidase superfamily)